MGQVGRKLLCGFLEIEKELGSEDKEAEKGFDALLICMSSSLRLASCSALSADDGVLASARGAKWLAIQIFRSWYAPGM